MADEFPLQGPTALARAVQGISPLTAKVHQVPAPVASPAVDSPSVDEWGEPSQLSVAAVEQRFAGAARTEEGVAAFSPGPSAQASLSLEAVEQRFRTPPDASPRPLRPPVDSPERRMPRTFVPREAPTVADESSSDDGSAPPSGTPPPAPFSLPPGDDDPIGGLQAIADCSEPEDEGMEEVDPAAQGNNTSFFPSSSDEGDFV